MCGITGFVAYKNRNDEGLNAVINTMTDVLEHRGPDGRGTWIDVENGVYLGHRRLSILDLSPSGSQPMISATGRYVITFNGEIYNFNELRGLLPATQWRGHSDTEVVLQLLEKFSIREVAEKLTGMFAMAIWDRQKRKISLVRDRMGEKPLYYGWQNGCFMFSSELKSICKHPLFANEIEEMAVLKYLQYGYIPAPYSIYKGIYKLSPGAIIDLDILSDNPQEVKPYQYWSVNMAIANQAPRKWTNENEMLDELHQYITDAVKKQSYADVEVGAFLSGGIDSSLVTSVLQANVSSQVHTFTLGFGEGTHNEAEFAKAVASHLGTKHTELYVSSNDILEYIPKLTSIFDEPFGDSSALPTLMVSQLASKHVKVVLSGDAGDELFAGYTRYANAINKWKILKRIAMPVKAFSLHKTRLLNQFYKKYPTLKSALQVNYFDEFYDVSISQWQRSFFSGQQKYTSQSAQKKIHITAQYEHMMQYDMGAYLPDDILVKVDRTSMFVSLETRVPFLDYRLVEFALSVPVVYKIKNGDAKWPLKQLLKRYVPTGLVDRPKMGFALPLGVWLRGPLKEWALDTLNSSFITGNDMFDGNAMKGIVEDFFSHRSHLTDSVWVLLMLSAWKQDKFNKSSY